MKLTLLGGGGFRVPLVHGALLADDRITEVALHDTDPARLVAMESVLAGQAAECGLSGRLLRTTTTSLPEALEGADFVFSAMRVGGLEGRVADESVAMSHEVLGQETTGAGGIAYGIRTVPVATHVAEVVRAVAPGAWVINFTNPAGMITEAMAGILGERVIGICDSPIGLAARAARALGQDLADLTIDYAGLNHLGWLQGLRAGAEDLLPRLLSRPELLAFEEGELFGPPWLADLGALPNEYLYYYYFTREARAAIGGAPATRGTFLRGQQEAFYGAVGRRPEAAYEIWRHARQERDETYMREARSSERDPEDVAGGGYERVALALMAALAGGPQARLVLNVRNTQGSEPSAVPGLPGRTVVEVPCAVSAGSVRPLPVTPLTGHRLGLTQQVAAAYASAIDAGLSGSETAAVRAFAQHPLVDSVGTARALHADYLRAIPEYAAAFGRRWGARTVSG